MRSAVAAEVRRWVMLIVVRPLRPAGQRLLDLRFGAGGRGRWSPRRGSAGGDRAAARGRSPAAAAGRRSCARRARRGPCRSRPAGRRRTRRAGPPRAAAIDLGVGRVRPADGDVLAHRRVEDEGLLEDEADLAAQRGERHVAHVVAVEEDLPLFGIPEAHSRLIRVLLPAAGRADDRDAGPGRDRQAQVAQDRPARLVAEGRRPRAGSPRENAAAPRRRACRRCRPARRATR